jgi:thioredoxin
MNAVAPVSQTTFDQAVLQSRLPVLIDFYAAWCGPCRMLAPTLQRLAAEFAGRVKIVKVNVDTEPELARRFRVESIPTLVFVAGGNVVGKTTGVATEASLRGALGQLAELAPSARRAS